MIGSKDYDGAIEILSTIEDYSDVKNLLAQCYYNKGSELLKAGKYDEAYDMYTKSEYDDYKKKASECIYQKAG
ncbi:dipeptidase, partial [Bifidobacterium pseudocatenulatum]|nr:dipeptidase [Bifidobacterium pseudocatenulatum]